MENLTEVIIYLILASLIVLNTFSFKLNSIKLIRDLSGILYIFTAALGLFGTFFFMKADDFIQVGFKDVGFVLRIDAISAMMTFMVSTIAFIIVRYSYAYLSGENKQNKFYSNLNWTVLSVLMLVLSDNLILLVLMWIATSLGLYKLLTYYHNRKLAVASAQKKSLLSIISALSLIVGIGLVYFGSNVFNLSDLLLNLELNNLKSEVLVEAGAVMIALAVFLKSAQIPFHGWLLDVMEAPTPVSALLHAGILNAGPFLLIRMAHLIEFSQTAQLMLITIGALTALYGTIVFPAQSAIKTSLAYSSIGHMGFSILLCGLGLYSAAMLHLTAHSFYKAYSFLGSGGIVSVVRVKKYYKPLVNSSNRALKNSIGFLLTLLIFTLLAISFKQDFISSLSLLILSSVIVFGVAVYMSNGLGERWEIKTNFKTLLISSFLLSIFFLLEGIYSFIFGGLLPSLEHVQISIEMGIAILVLITSSLILLATYTNNPSSSAKWSVYRRNGFYIHTVVDGKLMK